MEIDKAMHAKMRRAALQCVHRFRFAIPNKVIVDVLREFPHLAEEKGDLMDEVRKICMEVNKLKDSQIRKELEENNLDDTIIYE